MLELRNISKIYQTKTRRVAALDGVSFALPEKGFVFILGRSGSGKTTMLNMLGGLDAPTEGELIVDGVSSRDFKQADFDNYRNRYVGFVFQEYHLLDDYTVADNIALALELQGDLTLEERQQKIETALAQVDLTGYGERNTGELSGGQKQRVAIARALVKDPPMILADEPTGALDRKTGRQLFDLLKEISKDKLVVVVSHDEDFAHEYADRILELEEGKIIADSDSFSVKACTERNASPSVPNKSGFSAKSILRLGKNSMQRKKLRLTFTAVLCAVSFLLVSAADLLSAYEYRAVLASSLYDQQPSYITLSKEMYNDYDYSKPGLMLPTQEAVDWFASSGIKATGGTPGWQTEYMFTDDDLESLYDRTGINFKGVYQLQLESNYINMGIDNNYCFADQSQMADVYVDELTGFVEFTEQDLEAFGFSMLAGQLPKHENEIAISAYVYESFRYCGYRDYQGKNVLVTFSSAETGQIIEQRIFEQAAFLDSDLLQKTDADLESEFGVPVKISISFSGSGGKPQDINSPNDLIGKSLFLAGENYTISGIIDTGFDCTLYDPAVFELVSKNELTKDQLHQNELYAEYQRGLACLAFVGEGKIEQLATQHRTVIFSDSFGVTLQNEYGEFSINGFARASAFSEKFCDGSDWHDWYTAADAYRSNSDPLQLSNTGFSIYWWYDALYKGANSHSLIDFSTYDMDAGGTQDRAIYSKNNWKLSIYRESDNYMSNAYKRSLLIDADLPDGNELGFVADDLPRYALVSDFIFDLFTEGREGTYMYAVGPLPHSKGQIRTVVNGCLDENNGIRYHIGGVVAAQLDHIHDFLATLGRLCEFLSVPIIVFAMAVFAMFTILSIREKKQQIGIMRALGAGSRDVFAIFFTEGLLVAAISAVLATALTAITAIVGSALLRNLFELRLVLLNFSLRQAVMIFALSFGIAIVASIIPILRIAGQKPVDAIRNR